MSDSPEKLAAALAQLESERDRRIDVKVAEDKAIREPLVVVLRGVDGEVESAKAARLAELRAKGEKREIIFDCTCIVTVVPRSSDPNKAQPGVADDKPDYTSHLKRYEEKPIPPLPKAPKPKVEAPPNPQHVRTEVRQCKNNDDAGEIAEGFFQ